MPAKNNTSCIQKLGNTLAYILFAGNVVALLLLLGSMLAWYVPPSKMMVFSYLGMGFPFILVGNLLFLVFWLVFRKWKFLLTNVVVFIICWSPITTFFPIHFKTSEVPDGSIKLLTYNVLSFNRLQGKEALTNPMFDYIKSMDADIMCFQEFMAQPDNGGQRIITLSQINKVFGDYPYHVYINLGAENNTSGYGIACYSRFPITKAKRLPLYESAFNGSVAFELDINGKKVLLMNNHLSSNRITAQDKLLYKELTVSKDRETFEEVSRNMKARLSSAYLQREKDVDYIAQYIKDYDYDALIVCGDFNDTPISYAYHKMKGDLTDAYVNTGLGQGITYHENKFWFRIDYIMHSDEFESYNCEVGKEKHSDHYPVTTYLRWKE
ncbi:endonuclease/exonuclease/phosphatase family protein [Dysgonomonas sp. 25]|uniref:endonuclease/exonuclease/phosphatase family protein n=1 Tax=Dysgonomonas sp. 25 TaxID=2302933 RepID=UPI0013D22DC1|nr:endonuclease/exonuclease/phosphatase family protein [Dysgonomonas sp. 25]NDV69491.1 hypothetical protein [Dysgonomonas sp. 25]